MKKTLNIRFLSLIIALVKPILLLLINSGSFDPLLLLTFNGPLQDIIGSNIIDLVSTF